MASGVSRLAADFGVRLYRSCDEAGASVVLSPASIFVALSMTYVGASGETAAEMRRVLYDDKLTKKDVLAHAAEVMNSLRIQQENIVLRGANRIYCAKEYEISQPFLEHLRNHFSADALCLDFGSPEAVSKINSWVLQETAGKIANLLHRNSLSVSTALLLVNALYFKGNWLRQFDPKDTSDERFYMANGEVISIPMMHVKKGKFDYGEFADCHVLSMPYVGVFLKFFIVLPKDRFGLSKMEHRLTGETLLEMFYSVTEAKVDVTFPKFVLEKSISLRDALIRLGLTSMFSHLTANFSDISGGRGLFVSAVEHKTLIEVNEEGSEAAAATAVKISFRSAPLGLLEELSFVADHPFLFALVDTRSMNVLFLGRFCGTSSSSFPREKTEL